MICNLLLIICLVFTVNTEALDKSANTDIEHLRKELIANPDDPKIARALGDAMYNSGDWREALMWLWRSLELFEKSLGADHPVAIESRLHLADVYKKQGDQESADRLYYVNEQIKKKEKSSTVEDSIQTAFNESKKQELSLRNDLENTEKSLGKEHPEVLEKLDKLASYYNQYQQYKLAEPLLKRSITIRKKIFGKNHLQVGISLNNLASNFSQYEYKQANSFFKQSLPIFENALAKYYKSPKQDYPELMTILYNLSKIFENLHNYDKAEAIYNHIIAFNDEDNNLDDQSIIFVLNDLSNIYYEQSKIELIEPLLLRVLAITENNLGKEHYQVSNALDNLAKYYLSLVKPEKAEPILERSASIKEKAFISRNPNEENTVQYAEYLLQVSIFFAEYGNLVKSDLYLQRSQLVLEKYFGKEHQRLAPYSLINLAQAYETLGQYNKAELIYLRSIAILEKNSVNDINFLGALANCYEKQTKYDQAIAINLKLLNNNKDTSFKNSILSEIARLYFTQGKHDQAESFLLRYLNETEKDMASSGEIRGLGDLTKIKLAQNKLDQAESFAKRRLNTIDLEHSDANLYDLKDNLEDLARIYLSQDRYIEADEVMRRAMSTNMKIIEGYADAARDQQENFFQEWQPTRNMFVSYYKKRNFPGKALEFSLTFKNWLLRKEKEFSALIAQNKNPIITRKYERLKNLRFQISNMLVSGNFMRYKAKIINDQILQLEPELKAGNNTESQSVNKLGVFSPTAPITIKHYISELLTTKLSSNEVLIDYLIFKENDFKNRKNSETEQIIALIADQSNGVKMVYLGELASISKAIQEFKNAVIPSNSNLGSRSENLKKISQKLYSALWQPLSPYLVNKKTVYIVPDGELILLPFKALQYETGRFLGEQTELITLTSALDIVTPPRTGKPSKPVIFASPDYGMSNLKRDVTDTANRESKEIYLKPLPGTLLEGQQIDKLFHTKTKTPSQLFLKQQATEQAINAVHSPKVLHLATHGFFLDDEKTESQDLSAVLMRRMDQSNAPLKNIENPLTRSGLAFSGANLGINGIKQADGSDGILTALEVLNLDLADTDLVTLSACDTANGEVKNGEGVYSLSRAFQEAGAKAVLSTLWTVDDQATADFMKSFYNRYLDGKPPQQAIQETQAEFRQHERYKDPFYWAGFVMIGKD